MVPAIRKWMQLFTVVTPPLLLLAGLAPALVEHRLGQPICSTNLSSVTTLTPPPEKYLGLGITVWVTAYGAALFILGIVQAGDSTRWSLSKMIGYWLAFFATLLFLGQAVRHAFGGEELYPWSIVVWILSSMTLVAYTSVDRTIADPSKLLLRGSGIVSSAVALAGLVGLILIARVTADREPIDSAVLRRLTVSDFMRPGLQWLGSPTAKAVAIDIADLQCPACKAEYPALKASAGGNLRVAIIHYPLSYHRSARLAAILSEKLARYGKFWQFVDMCYSGALRVDRDFVKAAERLGLPVSEAALALVQQNTAVAALSADKRVADRLKIVGVPTIILFLPGRAPFVVSARDLRSILG